MASPFQQQEEEVQAEPSVKAHVAELHKETAEGTDQREEVV